MIFWWQKEPRHQQAWCLLMPWLLVSPVLHGIDQSLPEFIRIRIRGYSIILIMTITHLLVYHHTRAITWSYFADTHGNYWFLLVLVSINTIDLNLTAYTSHNGSVAVSCNISLVGLFLPLIQFGLKRDILLYLKWECHSCVGNTVYVIGPPWGYGQILLKGKVLSQYWTGAQYH